ncbi:MAG: winged helix-turn-helix transcriptional regulator [Planctomycetes bacterium]|nr:winged helix-turn-helix transcriptional regulator [Planctomycetota bacterium]
MSARPDDDAVWRALGDATRRALLDHLADGPRTTGELVARFPGLCRTAVMKHLDVLVAAGLVLVRRRGRERWNFIHAVPIQRVCERWIHRHVGATASALLRLEAHLEHEGGPTCPPAPRPRRRRSPADAPDAPPPDPAPPARRRRGSSATSSSSRSRRPGRASGRRSRRRRTPGGSRASG